MSLKSTPNLGAAMKERRKFLGLNLNQLAELSSVSRSMLSEIERGNANPTFTNLWNITQALGVSIDDLAHSSTDNQRPVIQRQAAIDTPRLKSDDQGCELIALNPVATTTEFEWYELIIQPGSQLTSEAHVRDTQEHLSVFDGEMQVTLDNDIIERAATGDTLRYPADVQHTITNSGTVPAKAFLVVHKHK